MSRQWYYSKQNQRFGPISDEQFQSLAKSGQLQPTDLIWTKGMANWMPANKVKGLTFASTVSEAPTNISPVDDSPLGFLDSLQETPSTVTSQKVTPSIPKAPASPSPVAGSPLGFLDNLQSQSVSAGKRIAQKGKEFYGSDAVQRRIATGKKKWLGLSKNQQYAAIAGGVCLFLIVAVMLGGGGGGAGGGGGSSHRSGGPRGGSSEAYQQGYQGGVTVTQGFMRLPPGVREKTAQQWLWELEQQLEEVNENEALANSRGSTTGSIVPLTQGKYDGCRETLAKNGIRL